eukprot:TRINITY_DN12671_c0_g1_i1.p1 TRINITY_DN12671_c0_g1~~TRINITY_DN12671_c0_g1_i1.p1  ORF type:complete len:202 (-),score=15.55 TRINITY_DN12671_c0_g1_i1:190-795(-)
MKTATPLGRSTEDIRRELNELYQKRNEISDNIKELGRQEKVTRGTLGNQRNGHHFGEGNGTLLGKRKTPTTDNNSNKEPTKVKRLSSVIIAPKNQAGIERHSEGEKASKLNEAEDSDNRNTRDKEKDKKSPKIETEPEISPRVFKKLIECRSPKLQACQTQQKGIGNFSKAFWGTQIQPKGIQNLKKKRKDLSDKLEFLLK